MIGLVRVFVVTAYSWGCGATGMTAYTNREPIPFFTAAVDRNVIHAGAVLEIDAPFVRGHVWYAEDTGLGDYDMVGNRIDLMVDNCEQAKWWGRREVRVRVIDIVPYRGRHNGLGKPLQKGAKRGTRG